MKKFIIGAIFLGFVSVNTIAAEVDTDHLMFPEDVAEAVRLAEEHDMLDGVRMVDEQDYVQEKPWVGATKKAKEPQDENADESLNRRFIEK